jgi:hypothetical protein
MSRSVAALRARRQDSNEVLAKSLYEVYDRINEDESVKYALGAMQPIDPGYTENTYQESDRVQNQIDLGLRREGLGAEFKHQGSVVSNTHIRAHSDIDLLVVEKRFYSLEPPLTPKYPYAGNVLQDLLQLRTVCETALGSAFPEAEINVSGGKAIAVSGGSLRRKIDVVISNWWDTVEYSKSGADYARGVEVLDKSVPARLKNKPFLHIKHLDDQDIISVGSLKKVIRLLKSLKYDSDGRVSISSYDISALAYAIPVGNLWVKSGHDLRLVEVASDFLRYLVDSPSALGTLDVPNGMRKIVCPDGASFAQVRALSEELDGLRDDIERGFTRSFKSLAEARVDF